MKTQNEIQKPKSIYSLVVIIAFFITYFIFKILKNLWPEWQQILPEHYMLKNFSWIAIQITPIALASILIFKKKLFTALSLDSGFLKGLGFAILFTLPMFVGPIFFYDINKELTLWTVWKYCIHAGLHEEIIFRAFLFGILFRYFKWGYIPAALLGAFFFGISHLYQGHSYLSALSAFGATAVGAVWFSWLFVEWRYNIWLVIWLHALMNLSWNVFNISGGAAGEGYSNIFRLLTIVITIVYTVIVICKKQGYIINKKVFWINKQ